MSMNGKGSLPSQEIETLLEQGVISGAANDLIKPSSLDLTISDEVYRMKGTYLPRKGESIKDLVKQGMLMKHSLDIPLDLNGIYLIRANQSLDLPDDIYAYSNNKSSSGRVNLQCRNLVDGVQNFDKIPRGYSGGIWIEVIPKSFPIKLSPGESLNQIRFFNADTRFSREDYLSQVEKHELLRKLDVSKLDDPTSSIDNDGLTMTIDLQSDLVGYRCRPTTGKLLDFSERDKYDPNDFFEPIMRPENGELVLHQGDFYILVTKELIRVPPDFSVEMMAYDPSKGEFRSHYAGFFDPGFGFGSGGEIAGSQAVLEVFTHDNDFVLRDGQPVCRMVYEYLSEKAEMIYGVEIGSNYQGQRGARLSKHFKIDESSN